MIWNSSLYLSGNVTDHRRGNAEQYTVYFNAAHTRGTLWEYIQSRDDIKHWTGEGAWRILGGVVQRKTWGTGMRTDVTVTVFLSCLY